MNPKWTSIPDPDFQKDMFEVGRKIRDMVANASGVEEGLNIALTIMATFACSMHDMQWRSMMRSIEEGIVGGEGPESKMERALQTLFLGLNQLRKQTKEGKSKYITKQVIKSGDSDTTPDDAEFTDFPQRGGLA